jgi:hypothetical protein
MAIPRILVLWILFLGNARKTILIRSIAWDSFTTAQPGIGFRSTDVRGVTGSWSDHTPPMHGKEDRQDLLTCPERTKTW